jgi:Flp pilus assembly protein CpaB
MTYRLRNILLAVVLAVLAAFLTALYVANYQNRVDEGREHVKVLVAKTDVAPGTPVAALTGKLTEEKILRKDVAPEALSDLDAVKGQFASQWIYGGEQVTARRFATVSLNGVQAELKGNRRAIQIAGDANQLLAGIVKTGDRVDVVANLKVSGDTRVARVILRDLKVLKAASSSGDSGVASGSNGSAAVVLQVTDTQAPKLLFVTSNDDHRWTLQLRPVRAAKDSPESISTLPSVLRNGLSSNHLSSTGGN